MLKNTRNICRVCFGPGEHNISAPIPFYLHEMGLGEAVKWQQPIRVLLQEITSIPVLPTDGLPQKMCTVCISYMKHAITFRNQALASRLGVLTATENKDRTKEWLCIPYLRSKPTTEDKNDKLKATNAAINKLQAKPKLPTRRHIPRITTDTSYFSFSQKPFVEDDITEIFDGQSVSASPSEKLAEKKCLFCRMRFMFQESFEDHTKLCIQKKFTDFTHQCNQMLQMKLEGKITPHEFIRRMVFMLKTNQDILDKLRDMEASQESSSVESLTLSGAEELSVQALITRLTLGTCETEPRKVFCSTCGKGLSTISHLDMHRIHCRK